ncbi:uncharacterized protein LOC119471875 [Cebus imitator]|uniref:uncharacterized protein LOC119471875 n=1 Tax=Cebus imitator TaxID=2715852 RepID=UPI00189A6B4E|nr:uncharacterized protein LOC119471875 [Cebus imitator]
MNAPGVRVGEQSGQPVPAASKGGAAGLLSAAPGPGPPQLCNAAARKVRRWPAGRPTQTPGRPTDTAETTAYERAIRTCGTTQARNTSIQDEGDFLFNGLHAPQKILF